MTRRSKRDLERRLADVGLPGEDPPGSNAAPPDTFDGWVQRLQADPSVDFLEIWKASAASTEGSQ